MEFVDNLKALMPDYYAISALVACAIFYYMDNPKGWWEYEGTFAPLACFLAASVIFTEVLRLWLGGGGFTVLWVAALVIAFRLIRHGFRLRAMKKNLQQKVLVTA